MAEASKRQKVEGKVDDGELRYAVVTGALGGIGRAIVTTLKANGFFVIGFDRVEGETDADRAFKVDLRDFHSNPERVSGVLADIRKETKGRLHLLVNNAAYQVVKPVDKLTTEDWDQTMSTNVTACFALSQTFLEDLKATKGSIINIGSIHANLTKPGFVAYATSKGAIVSLTRALAIELGPMDVRVNAILPAAIETPMLVAGFEGNPAGYESLAKHHPVERVGKPEEVAEFIVYLASDKSRFITGSCLQIDGAIGSRLHDPV